MDDFAVRSLVDLDRIKTEAAVLPAEDPTTPDLVSFFQTALRTAAQETQNRINELENLAHRCEVVARMDFTLLYDPARELFSIGYNVSQHRLDTSCYDLLASEARQASFVAIALPPHTGRGGWT